MKTGKEHIAGLETLTALSNDPETAVVMLHGYGANMYDLFPLWEIWNDGKLNWYFPNGVQGLPMGYYEGRAWFSIDMVALERAMREGKHRELSHSIPPEFDSTLKALEGFVREISKKHKKIILGGFSQGAMCATHLSLMADLPIEKLILLSGNLLAEPRMPRAARGIPFYQSHGTVDAILSLEGAKALETKLQALNFLGKLHVFHGGHEIPMEVIQGVKSFLAS